MSPYKRTWIPYTSEHYTVANCRETARKLRADGRVVRLGSYITDTGKLYCKVYVAIN